MTICFQADADLNQIILLATVRRDSVIVIRGQTRFKSTFIRKYHNRAFKSSLTPYAFCLCVTSHVSRTNVFRMQPFDVKFAH